MDTATIARLLQPFGELPSKQLEQTAAYLDLLLKWNAKVNLTAVRNPEQIITRHFGESLFLARRLLSEERRHTIIDLGSGAGFPGLPVAMFATASQVTLIEAHGKKAAFLNEVIAALALKNAKVARQRGEDFAGSADLVTMRAVENFEEALPVAWRLVRPGGRLALMIGESQAHSAMKLIVEARWSGATALPGSDSRVILIGTKTVTVGGKG